MNMNIDVFSNGDNPRQPQSEVFGGQPNNEKQQMIDRLLEIKKGLKSKRARDIADMLIHEIQAEKPQAEKPQAEKGDGI